MNNKFKFFRLLLIAVTLISTAMLFNACDPADDTTGCELLACENGGTCIVDQFGDAVCECPPNFSGPDCSLVDCIIVECPPNSTCADDGSAICNCDPGYEPGIDPSTGEEGCISSGGNWLGVYIGTDVCAIIGESDPYQCNITADPGDASVLFLENLGGFNLPVKAVIENSTQITIPSQRFNNIPTQFGTVDFIFEGTTFGALTPSTGNIGVSYKFTCVGCDTNGADIVDDCDTGLIRQ